MDDRASLDLEGLRRDLARRGLPIEYIDRVADELDDHRQDAASTATDRIGDPSRLADFVTQQYQSRSFPGRHPILTFLVAPIPVAVLAWATCVLVAVLLAELLSPVLGDFPRSAAVGIGRALVVFLTFGVPAVLTIVFSRLASRAGRGWPWQIASCLLLTVMSGLFMASMTESPVPGEGLFAIGFGSEVHPLPMLLPIGIAAIYGWQRWRPSPRLA